MRPIFASENNIGVRTCYKPGTNQATYDASRVGVCAAKVARWIGNMSKLGANPGTGVLVRSDPGNERAAILQSLFSMKYIYKAGRIYDEDAHVRWLASQCEWATANAISQLNFFGVLSCIRDNPPAQWFVIVEVGPECCRHAIGFATRVVEGKVIYYVYDPNSGMWEYDEFVKLMNDCRMFYHDQPWKAYLNTVND